MTRCFEQSVFSNYINIMEKHNLLIDTKGMKKPPVFCVLLQDISLAIGTHCLCHHEGCGALLDLLLFRRDIRLHTALLIIKQ